MPVRKLTEATHNGLTLDPRGTGKFLVKIIDAGEGATAIYTPEALQRSERVFPAGTHMYLDHADDRRRGVHGERSVRDLVSVLTADAHYSDADGGLLAEAQALPGYESTLEALAPHVGLSINALAEVEPPTSTGGKPVVTQILAAESVDWVVKAGRGGAVLAVLESAGVTEASSNERREQLTRALRDAYGSNDTYVWVRDFDDDTREVVFEISDALYRQSYDATDLSVTLTGERVEVRAVTQFVPVTISAGVAENESPKEELMPEITQAELDALNAQITAATQRAEAAEAKITEAAAAALTATNHARIAEACAGLPEQMAARVTASFAGRADEVTAAEAAAAVDAERTYAASLTESGRLTGFGATTTTEAKRPARTTNAFGRTIKES